MRTIPARWLQGGFDHDNTTVPGCLRLRHPSRDGRGKEGAVPPSRGLRGALFFAAMIVLSLILALLVALVASDNLADCD